MRGRGKHLDPSSPLHHLLLHHIIFLHHHLLLLLHHLLLLLHHLLSVLTLPGQIVMNFMEIGGSSSPVNRYYKHPPSEGFIQSHM